jgi:hypothetical protein
MTENVFLWNRRSMELLLIISYIKGNRVKTTQYNTVHEYTSTLKVDELELDHPANVQLQGSIFS